MELPRRKPDNGGRRLPNLPRFVVRRVPCCILRFPRVCLDFEIYRRIRFLCCCGSADSKVDGPGEQSTIKGAKRGSITAPVGLLHLVELNRRGRGREVNSLNQWEEKKMSIRATPN
jgi:hypothetical protein